MGRTTSSPPSLSATLRRLFPRLHLPNQAPPMTKLRLLPLAILVLAVAVLGCSKKSLAPARISGSLSYNGKPIKGGTMAFYGPDGVAYNAAINPDGTYSATDIPEGELVVTVETESINPNKTGGAMSKEGEKRLKTGTQPPPEGRGSSGGGGPPPSELYIKIPEKYNNAKTSPLTVTTKSGRQVENIDLKD